MELWAQRHGVNHDRLFIWVLVEDDDLKQIDLRGQRRSRGVCRRPG
jgi:hypothetical protein